MQRNQWFYRLLGVLLLAMTIFSQANTARAEAVVYDPGTGGITFSVDDTSVCGQVTLVFYNPTNTYAAPEYKVDDQEPTGSHPVVPDDGFYTVVNLDGRPTGANVHEATRVLTFEEDSGSHTYAIRLKLGGERDWDYDWQELTFDNTDCVPPPDACPAITGPTVATFSNPLGWDFSQTRSTGHYEFVGAVDSLPQGLKIYTESNASTDKVAGYFPTDFSLADMGQQAQLLLEYHAIPGYPSAPPAALQAVMDFDNDTVPDGILVYEPGYYGDIWWNNNNTVYTNFPDLPHGGGGYLIGGPLHEMLTAYPDARVLGIGFSLGSGVFGGGIISSMTIGCHEYQFAPDEVEPEAPTFNEPTCHVPTASVGFPNNDFEYVVTGETVPGGSVHVMANLKPEVMNTIAVGTTEWDYTFVTVESLNCLIEVAAEGASITVIDQCGIYGSVTPSVTEGITYEVIPENPKEGLAIIEATANEGYVIVGQNRVAFLN